MRHSEHNLIITSTSLERKPLSWAWVLLFGLLALTCLLVGCRPVSAPPATSDLPGGSGSEMNLPPLPEEADELVLVPLQLLDLNSLSEQPYWVLSPTGSESKKDQLVLQPILSPAPPEAGVALVAKELLPPDVKPVGDLFVRGQTSLPQHRFLLDPSLVLSDSVTISDDSSLLSFDLRYDDSPMESSTGDLRLEVVCLNCAWNDYCRLDPWGCLCEYIGCRLAEPLQEP
jgi:hypothetical protein